ncbi:MAG: xylulokinase [Acidimicrobiia bacterium]|nr:xylulokinase [Acidimicrobiia bacterium]
MSLVLGVDSSTQSTKVEIRELNSGRVVGVGRAPHPPTTPPRSEQDPASWWSALLDALGQVGDHLPDVVAVAVAGQQHGLVVLDGDGVPMRPAKLWNDTESAPQAAALVASLGATEWATRCGSVPTASFTITKLAWLLATAPDIVGGASSVMLPHDYLTWRLSGARVTDRGDASGTGWWSPVAGDYDRQLLGLLGAGRDLAPLLPRVAGPTESVGEVTSVEARALGLGPNVIVGPGTGDNMAGAAGLGLVPGDVAVSIGTSGTVYGVSSTPTSDPTGAVAGFADATGRHLPLVCTLNASKVTDTVGRLLAVEPGELSDLALQAEPGAGCVTVVPYFDGERTPNLPLATGTITGLRSDTGRDQLARAAYEGVVCGLLDGLDALGAAGVAADGRLFLIGGGARAEAYQRAMADLAGRSIVVPDSDETVATGACVQAAAVLDQTGLGEVAARWRLDRGVVVEHDVDVDAAAIRTRYREQAARHG